MACIALAMFGCGSKDCGGSEEGNVVVRDDGDHDDSDSGGVGIEEWEIGDSIFIDIPV